ncbi:short-chain dehydrogenase/reductase 1-like [Nicotiana tabacum]|uniref:Short-chain dehydrogenase/reductase n=5 Tax=Nicotiana tabacum TaxID=4097 RepID=A0A1S3X091_TOBAC|nr:short-chain dehydrogenase/reductase 2b-like [Nicotiana tomentosiformis]XP_009620593.1 short-chain dehydrogenase/reductase 2b-like [Nicotiana tomentosiformis]XP_016433300.1 PREDICTED: short-chain dehydrogenase/reductase 2b-like [Nicotiana tabacum]XP_016433302.1 PREDICTED: short-chain dehydrogenase/reductase 2b-like [Nicotiana tabacum]XP_016433303.1 PREDICTED: short-chain dehydrogenase/reductase 2b-like [Nicotiana tabacum]XP_016433304.1 PREDICTED: short-chain dehydrogenase/reductase 2b-like [
MEVNVEKAPERYAVVTGANKGIGFEIVKQLAISGVTVILTARNEERGMEAISLLNKQGFPTIVFHQLDVQDAQSIESLAKFIQTQYGRLDILVNNAGRGGVVVDEDVLRTLNIDPVDLFAGKAGNLFQVVTKLTYESAKLCFDTNYYGVKNVTEALLPLLQNSPLARIVNVSSRRGALKLVPNEERRKELGDIENLTEDKIYKILQKFLDDLEQDALEMNGWQMIAPAYSISKATLNAYTRLLVRRYPKMCINCVHPGFVNTDLTWHAGTMTVEEGAEGPVMLALLPDGGPNGCYFDRTTMAEF